MLDPRGEGSDGVDARAQNQYASYMQNTPNDKAAPADSAHPPEIDPSFDDDIPF